MRASNFVFLCLISLPVQLLASPFFYEVSGGFLDPHQTVHLLGTQHNLDKSLYPEHQHAVIRDADALLSEFFVADSPVPGERWPITTGFLQRILDEESLMLMTKNDTEILRAAGASDEVLLEYSYRRCSHYYVDLVLQKTYPKGWAKELRKTKKIRKAIDEIEIALGGDFDGLQPVAVGILLGNLEAYGGIKPIEAAAVSQFLANGRPVYELDSQALLMEQQAGRLVDSIEKDVNQLLKPFGLPATPKERLREIRKRIIELENHSGKLKGRLKAITAGVADSWLDQIRAPLMAYVKVNTLKAKSAKDSKECRVTDPAIAKDIPRLVRTQLGVSVGGPLFHRKIKVDESIERRNEAWRDVVSEAIAQGHSRIVLVCGAGHMYGPTGMVDYFRSTGCNIRYVGEKPAAAAAA
jgi:hypothetical protein